MTFYSSAIITTREDVYNIYILGVVVKEYVVRKRMCKNKVYSMEKRHFGIHKKHRDLDGEGETERVDNRNLKFKIMNLCFIHTSCSVSTLYTSPDNRADTSNDST